MQKILFVWLEGSSDEQFFDASVAPILRERYLSIQKVLYAERSNISINRKLKEVVRSKAILDYLWFADLDPDQYPCVTERKRAEIYRYPLLEPDRIAVVIPEVEAWYLAGLDAEACAELGIPEYIDTGSITKERLKHILPTVFSSAIDFRTDVLDRFSLDVARIKNKSFAHFCRNHLDVT
jgi:hypothetical protein